MSNCDSCGTRPACKTMRLLKKLLALTLYGLVLALITGSAIYMSHAVWGSDTIAIYTAIVLLAIELVLFKFNSGVYAPGLNITVLLFHPLLRWFMEVPSYKPAKSETERQVIRNALLSRNATT